MYLEKKKANKAKMIAIIPWMMLLGITDAIQLYTYGYIYNATHYFESWLRLERNNEGSVSNYVYMNKNTFLDALNGLISKGLVLSVPDDDDDDYYYVCCNPEVKCYEWKGL